MKTIIPIVKIKNNVLTTQPFTPDSTLVDDTVRLVDDPAALSGGNTVIVSSIKAQIRIPRVQTKIKRRR